MNQSNQMKEVQPKQSKFRQLIGNIAFGITLIVCLFVVLFCSMGNNRKMETASADSSVVYADEVVAVLSSDLYNITYSDSFSSLFYRNFSGTVSSIDVNFVYFSINLSSFPSNTVFTFVYHFYTDLPEDSELYLTYFSSSWFHSRFLKSGDFYYFTVDLPDSFISLSTGVQSLSSTFSLPFSYNFDFYIYPGEYNPSVGVPLVLQVFDVWGQIAEWFAGCFPDITQFFYVDGSLTFAGTCAVIMAGVALILLIFNLIRSFLPMRG